jgi:CRP-like cAMP-binding protein
MRIASRRERYCALRAVRELESCSDQEVESLLAYTDEAHVFAGEQVALEGRLCTELVVVIDGTLRARSSAIGPGGSFGWDAMWEHSTNRATVVAETDVRVLVMGRAQFRAVKAVASTMPLQPCVPDEVRVPIVA